MKLKLIFLGEKPVPSAIISDVVQKMDKRLFQLESQRIRNLHKVFPEIERSQARQMASAFRLEYRSKAYSMLQIESMRRGCVIVIGVVSAGGAWIVLNTVGESFKDAYKESGMHQQVKEVFLRKLKYFFVTGQKDILIRSAHDVADKYERFYTPSQISNIVRLDDKDRPVLLTDAQEESDTGDTLAKYVPSQDKLYYAILPESEDDVVQEAPPRLIKFVSIEPMEPEHGQHTLDVRIQVNESLPPPFTYAELADDYNEGR